MRQEAGGLGETDGMKFLWEYLKKYVNVTVILTRLSGMVAIRPKFLYD